MTTTDGEWDGDPATRPAPIEPSDDVRAAKDQLDKWAAEMRCDAPGDPARWTVDDKGLLWWGENIVASVSGDGPLSDLYRAQQELADIVEAARVHEGCTQATDTLREVLHLWMGGWRPRFDLWVNGWAPSETKPLTPAHRAVLNEANPTVEGPDHE